MSVSNAILLIGSLFLVFLGMAIVIKMRWISKKPSRLGTQVTGQAILMEWMNKDKKTAMEEVIYQQEEQEEDSDSGEGLFDFSPAARSNPRSS